MWDRLIKLVGWGILLAFLASEPVDFEPRWLGLYLAINGGVALAATLVVLGIAPIFRRFWPQECRSEATTHEKQGTSISPSEKNRGLLCCVLRRPVLELMLIPGEDGLFFVPLLLVGVTWVTALPVALLFGFVHYNRFSAFECAGKAASAYLVCLFILPHGILHFVIGHLLLDVVAFGGIMILCKEEYYAARGDVLYRRGAYQKAIAALSEALRRNPKLEVCWYTRGHAWVAVGDIERALADYDAALALSPHSAEIHAARGAARCRIGRHEEALGDFEQALTLNPQLDWAFAYRAGLRLQRGECDLAIADYTEALRLRPEGVDCLVGRSTAFNDNGSLEKALADCERALELAPGHVLAHSNRGWTLLQLGRYQEGIRSFERGLALDANCAPILEGLARILATCPDQDFRDGTRALEYARRLNERPDTARWKKLYALAFACAECGSFAEAVAHITAALESMPEHMKAGAQALVAAAAFRAGTPYYFKPRAMAERDMEVVLV